MTRHITSATGALAATTGKTGDVVLQLTNIHGDVAMLLPLDTSKAPVALDADEFGNPRTGQQSARYGWLGGQQRSSETVTGTMLMGVRMYSPTTGRFLTSDPVYGGSATAYDYANQDPGNQFDPSGRMAYVRTCGTSWRWWGYTFSCTFYVTRFHTKMLKEDLGTLGAAGRGNRRGLPVPAPHPPRGDRRVRRARLGLHLVGGPPHQRRGGTRRVLHLADGCHLQLRMGLGLGPARQRELRKPQL